VGAEMGQSAAQDVDLVGDEWLRTVSICSETARFKAYGVDPAKSRAAEVTDGRTQE